jgi:hypothetical protein
MDFFNHNNTEVLIVNYNTPDFILDLYNQIREFISEDIVINVVDGSDDLIKKRGVDYVVLNEKMKNVLSKDKNTNHYLIGYNIHHGPGMDYGLNKIQKKYVLILDSDVKIPKKGLLELFSKNVTENFYCMGNIQIVDDRGMNIKKNGIKYVHPSVMILDKEFYIKFNTPFIKHGAPCLNFMRKINPEFLIDVTDIYSYVDKGSRGTINIFGINL